MQIKQLNKFVQDYQLENNQTLIKHLVIIGIHHLKKHTPDISNITIKMIASICKEQNLQQELKCLRKKVVDLERHMTGDNKPKSIDKFQSQPHITPKITESIPPVTHQPKRATPFKHHLDDTEIKSILWNQFNNDQQLLPKELSRHTSQQEFKDYRIDSGQITVRENRDSIGLKEQSGNKQTTQRSSFSSQQFENKSPRFQEQVKKSFQKENKIQEAKVPKHLKKVESKIKQQISQDRQQFKSGHLNRNSLPEPETNRLNSTPQNKQQQYFQLCNSTQFGGNLSSGNNNKFVEKVTDGKFINMDDIANSFLQSPFLKTQSQVKQRLFRQNNSNQKLESAYSSSISSNFSLFNPRDDLRNFFQKESALKQIQNQLQYQF
ncbi:hypothetical protein pb186bvf_002338 [Paramecium bursaria]